MYIFYILMAKYSAKIDQIINNYFIDLNDAVGAKELWLLTTNFVWVSIHKNIKIKHPRV